VGAENTTVEDELLFHLEGETGVITFNRPGSRNALTFEMYERLASLCQSIIDQSIKVNALIITGAGEKAFAAGTDISNFRGFSNKEDALNYERTMDRVLGILESVPIPTVAAIQGACTGGGAAIAACCDMRIARSDIRFGFPIARTLGNCLSITNLSRLAELLGAARTREILLTSRLITIDEALAINLVNEVAPEPLARAHELCELMRGHAPLTMAASKEGLRRLREASAQIEGDDLIVQCYTSEVFREGMDAFLTNRPPLWRGC